MGARSDWGRIGLEQVGVVLTPELEACLWPVPKEKIVAGGLQAGKSVEGAAEVFLDLYLRWLAGNKTRFPTGADPAGQGGLDRTWVILPTYSDPNREMHYLAEWMERIGWIYGGRDAHFPEGSSATIRAPWFLIESKTAQDLMGVSGETLNRVLVVESGRMPVFVREQALARVLILDGRIVYTGTLEDDEAFPRFAWYGERAAEWTEKPSERAQAFSLPTWANPMFLPLGRQDPRIVEQEQVLDSHTFSRRYAGTPAGVQDPVYPQLAHKGFFDRWGTVGSEWIWSLGVGGHDYGEGIGGKSPCTLAAITVNVRDEAWVREIRRHYSSDTDWVESNRRELSTKYRIPLSRWAFDPMQREAAAQQGVHAARTGQGARRVRVGKVAARLDSRRLFFDLSGTGVEQAYQQMRRVHYRKIEKSGQGMVYEYTRIDDDDAAAIEMAIELLDAGRKVDYSAASGLSTKPRAAVVLR